MGADAGLDAAEGVAVAGVVVTSASFVVVLFSSI
jgi:hypothetical protein